MYGAVFKWYIFFVKTETETIVQMFLVLTLVVSDIDISGGMLEEAPHQSVVPLIRRSNQRCPALRCSRVDAHIRGLQQGSHYLINVINHELKT